ncbi:MAG: serine--tRNA ligase [Candidatus Cloacimonadia bacterium]
MLDINFIRKNTEFVERCIKAKGEEVDFKNFLEIDQKRRELQYRFDKKREVQKEISKKIGNLKKAGKDTDELLAEMKSLAEEIKSLSTDLNEVNEKFESLYLSIPNVFADDVPLGKTEADNVIVREWGSFPKFDFEPLDHVELSEKLGLIDFRRSAKIAGTGFVSYTGFGARLERALINFMLDFHRKNGYTEILPPFMANRRTMTGTGQLPKLEDDMYRVEEDDFFLIPTGEVPVTNFYQDEVLDEDELPKKYVSYTPCFRREAGSYGKKTRGLQRIHQFNKVELVQFVKPEDSELALQEIVSDVEGILQTLNLPYRVNLLCSGDLSFAAYKCYDLDVWAEGTKKYLEVSSCSSFNDFQARRANIRYRARSDGKLHFVHTLNGSGIATPRTMIALLENNQTRDGKIIIPDSLRKYYR